MNPSNGNTVDPEKAAERAHVLLESEINARLDAVRALAKRLNDLDTAIADYLAGWQLAQRAGWTESTLADIGLRAPDSLPAQSGRRAADGAEGVPAPAPAAVPSTAAAVPSTAALAPVVALTPPPAPATPSVVTAPAFGPAPTLGSVSSFPSTNGPTVVSSPSS